MQDKNQCFLLNWKYFQIFSGKCQRKKYQKVASNKELVNQTIAVFDWSVNNDPSLCMVECFRDNRCVSFNFCSTPYGWKECRLLNSSHFKNGSSLINKQGCDYYTSEVTTKYYNFITLQCMGINRDDRIKLSINLVFYLEIGFAFLSLIVFIVTFSRGFVQPLLIRRRTALFAVFSDFLL